MVRIILIGAAFVGAAIFPWDSLTPAWSAVVSRLAYVQLWSSSRMDRFPAYRTSTVERGEIVTTVQAAGTLSALVVIEVGTQISGLVKELYADFNSRVSEGQVIARVEPEMYEAKVAQARAELEMAMTMVALQRAQVERTQAELENVEARYTSGTAETMGAKVALENATQELERKRPLARRDFVAAGEWDRIQNLQKSAHAKVAAARANELSQLAAIRAAQAELRMAEAQLANTLAQVTQREIVLRLAKIDLDRTYIRAPVTGTVINRAISGGQTLAATLQSPVLFTIAKDLTQMQVEASVVEADVSRFAVGQPVKFTVDAYPDHQLTGTVQQIRKAPKMVENVVTYIVVVTAENPDELLLPGMTANLQVVTAQHDNVLKVSNAALRFRPKGAIAEEDRPPRGVNLPLRNTQYVAAASGTPGQVYVLGEDGEPKLVSLLLGITDGRMTEVLAGELRERQLVITGLDAASAKPDSEPLLVKFRLQ